MAEKATSLFKTACRLALGGAFAVLCVELVMRQVCFVPRTSDPDFGFVVQPGARARWAVEGNGTGHYHERGVRAPFEPASKAPKVLVVGDSFTEALHVDDEQTFAAVAQQAAAREGTPVQTVNVGVAGFRTPKYIELAPKYAATFEPAWTVIVLNDDDLLDDMFLPNDTYFVRTADGELTVQSVPLASRDGFLKGLWQKAKTTSAVIQRGGLQLFRLAQDARATRLFRGGDATPRRVRPAAKDYPVERALEKLHDAYRPRLTLMLLSPVDLEHPEKRSDVEEIFTAFCRKRNASCLHGSEMWSGLVAQRLVPFGFPNRGFNMGHLNEAGHRAAGEALGAELSRLRRDGLL